MAGSIGTSRTGMRLIRGVGRALPRGAAPGIIATIARRMAADQDGSVAKASRLNQWVISGCVLEGAGLDAAVRANVEYMARSLYDLYHVLGSERRERELVVIDDVFRNLIELERSGDGPFVYVGAHFGNFDLVGRQLGFHGWRMQLLSVAGPHGGYEWQNEVREQAGFDVTPVSIDSLKRAARGLAEGRSVLTGLDRPLDAPDKAQPRFFGHESPLPLLHVRLAMRADVPVVVIAAPRDPDGRYRLVTSDPIAMEAGEMTPERMRANAERCLSPVEGWIRENPEQWAMPHVAWPQLTPPPIARSDR